MRACLPPGRPPVSDPETDDTIPEADRAIFAARCLEKYAKGMSPDAIAFEEKVNHWTVWTVIKEAAEAAREGNREYAAAVFVQQDLGVRRLICKAHEAVDRAAAQDPPVFDKDAVRVLILLYERQAKLLGLDRAKVAGERERNDWLNTASEEDLRKRAKHLGIRIPESIVSPSTMPA